MNLHGIASGYINAVNPFIPAQVKLSAGYTTDASGLRVPDYLPIVETKIQRQDLNQDELAQIDGLNIQGVKCAIYVNGNFWGANRVIESGGDIFTFSNQNWLVIAALELWPDWCKLAVCLQR